VWSRSIIWSLIGLTTFAVVYGLIARIESSINATGKLRVPPGATEVSSPFNALVQQVLVKEGQRISSGQPLLMLRDRSLVDQRRELERLAALWSKEVNLLALQIGDPAPFPTDPTALRQLQTAQTEVGLREQAATSERGRSQIQLLQQSSDLQGLREKRALNRNLLERMIPLQMAGALSQLEVDRQRERLVEVETALRRTERELDVVGLQVQEAEAKVRQIPVADRRQLFAQYDNARQQLIEVNTRITGIDDQLRLGRITAPVSGTVFDLKARKGEILGPGRPALKLVPQGLLEASISISNSDVGLVKTGQSVEVRVDSFPFTDYGFLRGKIKRISADSLPPDQTHPQEYFAATVVLEQSELKRNNTSYKLRPGMSVTALIKTGSRPVIALITDRFIQFWDAPRSIR